MAENIDPLSALNAFFRAAVSDMNTCIEGVIVSYEGGKASVQPIGTKRFSDGDELDYPVLDSVPVRWPTFSGGSAGVKGPIVSGDKCLLVFSQQAIDGTDDMRQFDINDAYAVMCDGSTSGQGGSNDAMCMYFGSAYIRITKAGALEINAPGGTTHTSPTITNKGNVVTTGTTQMQGAASMTGGGESTGGFTNTGGTVSSNGVTLESHVHSGVTAGGANTGGPV